MRRIVLIVLPLLVAVVAAVVALRRLPEVPSAAVGMAVKVIEVMDGDSLRVRTEDGREIIVRMYGVDAPEKDQPFAQQARAHTTDVVEGAAVRLEVVDVDQYGRSVGIVTAGQGGESVNERLVAEGLAWRYDKHCDREPYCEGVGRREREAREARRGLWADPAPTPPWQWRWEVRQQPEQELPAGLGRQPLPGTQTNAVTPGLVTPNSGADVATTRSGATQAPPTTRGQGCTDFRTARDRHGKSVDCYPYRCIAGTCLTQCRAAKDCAGSQVRGDFREGWPLDCVNQRCVPKDRREVERQSPR